MKWSTAQSCVSIRELKRYLRSFRGVPTILLEIRTRSGIAFKPYSYTGFEKLIQNLRKEIGGLPSYFTLDVCRHG